jgi:serine/threonine protein kinase/tetratricopeptide (TPR) repeat protein
MGVVYAARDERLQRTVALKTMLSVADDDTARRRFWREARAAASVNHPNICQIYEIGEEGRDLFIAMELLEGEPLSELLRQGPMSVSRTVSIGMEMLAALGALHARGIVHRDLKPSNVFLTPHGIKLLDFGLARPELEEQDGSPAVTRTGVLIGTPRYMAPEVVSGEGADARSDLFAAGAILFEMLAGRPAFAGRTIAEIVHATVYEQPPALTGSAAVAAVDRVIRRSLSKRPADRLPSAEVMAEELSSAGGLDDDTTARAHTLTRLVVLPFRMLRPDPETDFLAFSLPDAITTSLSGIGSLVVRSSATAARFTGETPDLKTLAAEANVDRVVMGTLLRSGDQLRAVTQLVEAPGGTVLTSHTVQTPLGDLFRLQDDIARRMVDALSLPLTGIATPSPDAPRDARAYELYLRANELARSYDSMSRAQELYQRCVDLDPSFAPAWAHLGRAIRVVDKYIVSTPGNETRAQQALERALSLNPRLSIAHRFYAQLESDIGQAPRALVRLVEQATRHGNEPELFSGLVHACRYCGLYDASRAAHAEARRLDPNIETGVDQTMLMAGDIDAIAALQPPEAVAGADDGISVIALGLWGDRELARERLVAMAELHRIPLFQTWTAHLAAWLDRNVDQMLATYHELRPVKIMDDPEAVFQEGWLFCDVGEYERALEFISRAVARGYFVSPTMAAAPQFDALRGDSDFQKLLADAEAGRQLTKRAFREAGGERLLGTSLDDDSSPSARGTAQSAQ